MRKEGNEMSDSDPDCSKVLLRNGIKPNNISGKSGNLEQSNAFQLEHLQYECIRLRRYFYGLTAVVITGILILIIVVAVLFGKLSHDLVSHEHKPKVGEQIAALLKQDDLCVPCDNIRLGPSVEEDKMLDKFSRKHEHEGEVCCVETPGELLLMLELFVERRYREEMARGNRVQQSATSSTSSSGDRPAAHLMGSMSRFDEPSASAPGKQFEISHWLWDVDLAFTNQVTYRHGRLVVPSDGYYYIYSQIAFLEVYNNANTKDISSANTLSHYLYRYNIIYPRGGEEKLTQNSITKCVTANKQFGEYTSHIGALFKLRSGDEIFVKVSNISLVVREPKLNYFGLFKLSSL